MAPKKNELGEELEAIKNEKKALEEILKLHGDGGQTLNDKGTRPPRSTSLKRKGLEYVVRVYNKLSSTLLQSKGALCKLGFGGRQL